MTTGLWRAATRAVTLLALALTVATAPAARAPARWPPLVTPMPSPTGPNSSLPQLSTSARGTVLSWVERRGTRAVLRFAERRGAGWSSPRTVASGDDWFVNWADVPSVVLLDDGTMAAHWLQKNGDSRYAYDVRLSHSGDDGRTWTPSFTPHHDGTRTEHGFASLFQMPGLGLGLVWLDGRATSEPGAHDATHAPSGGAMTIRSSTYDRGWRQVSDEPVDLRVCDCCPTAAAVTSDGPIVAFRNRTEDEVRDIHVSRLEAGRWTTPVAVHDDGWKIAACPVNGPMLGARGRAVAVAWFTAVGDVGHAYVAFSGDAGRTFGAPVRLDDHASLGRVDVELLPDGSAVASWIELTESKATLMIRGVRADGTRLAAVPVAPLDGSRAAGVPRLALHGEQLTLAWTHHQDGVPMVRTATAVLAR